jgi:hypothetical protein
MIPSEIWALIGVVVGAAIGFGLELLRGYIQEKRQKRKYLKDLLADLEYNKRLAEKAITYGYHTSGYIEAKEAKYLSDLPEELRVNIDSIQRIILSYRLHELPPLIDADFDKFKSDSIQFSENMNLPASAVISFGAIERMSGFYQYKQLKTEQLKAVASLKALLERVIPELRIYLNKNKNKK